MLFLVPLVVMLSLSLQSCNTATGACVMTWHWGEFGQQLSLYHTQFITSFYFAGAATIIDLIVSFPIAYWIAFHGGNRKNFFLLMLLVPFFVSFVIRTDRLGVHPLRPGHHPGHAEERAPAAAELPRAGHRVRGGGRAGL